MMVPLQTYVAALFLFFGPGLTGGQLEEKPETTTPGPTICKKDENGPDFIPNVYECKSTERCCNNQGAPSCCSTEITNDAIIEQAIMWGSIIGIFLVVGICASCYFKDRYCCDGDDEGGCCGTLSDDKYKSRFSIKEHLYPDVVKANQVEDPIFGATGKPRDVPQFASVDDEALQRAKITTTAVALSQPKPKKKKFGKFGRK